MLPSAVALGVSPQLHPDPDREAGARHQCGGADVVRGIAGVPLLCSYMMRESTCNQMSACPCRSVLLNMRSRSVLPAGKQQ